MLDRKAARSKSVPAPDIPGVEFARTVLALLEDEFDATLVAFDVADGTVTMEMRIPVESLRELV